MKIKLIIPFIFLLYISSAGALTLNGFTGFSSIIELNARVSGLVQSIDVTAGQRVKKGDVLIKFDDLPYQVGIDRATALENSLLPVVQTAQLELERAEELYDRDSLSQVALKNAQNILAEAEGKYQAATADRVLAEYRLKNAVIHSPLDGRVLQLHTNIDQYIDPAVNGEPLISLVDSQQMLAKALINSEQWDSSLLGKQATVQFGDKQFTGKVSYLGYQRIEQANGLSAYEIHVSFKTSQLIPAEMPVTINITE